MACVRVAVCSSVRSAADALLSRAWRLEGIALSCARDFCINFVMGGREGLAPSDLPQKECALCAPLCHRRMHLMSPKEPSPASSLRFYPRFCFHFLSQTRTLSSSSSSSSMTISSPTPAEAGRKLLRPRFLLALSFVLVLSWATFVHQDSSGNYGVSSFRSPRRTPKTVADRLALAEKNYQKNLEIRNEHLAGFRKGER